MRDGEETGDGRLNESDGHPGGQVHVSESPGSSGGTSDAFGLAEEFACLEIGADNELDLGGFFFLSVGRSEEKGI